MGAPNFLPANHPAPAEYAVAVTPSDGSDLAQATRALYIGVAGNVAVNMPDGGSVTFVGLTAGQILPIRAKRVLATGTTATSIVALY